MKHRCPVCHKTIKIPDSELFEESGYFPFCSQRCKFIDLGSWLDAEYKIVSVPHLEESEEPSEVPSTTSEKI